MMRNTSKIQDTNGWCWKFKNNKQDSSISIKNQFHKVVEKITSSFYITNFPYYVDAKRLWVKCQSYGRIVDEFIANKISKAGKRFEFVRFLGVKNEKQLARSLASIWIGSYHLFAYVARFNRQEKNEAFSKNNGDKTTNSIPSQRHTMRDHLKTRSLMLLLLMVIEIARHVIGIVKDLNSISNLRTLLTKEGFLDVKLTYLGGMWVMIELDNEATKLKLLQHIGVNSWFHVLQATIHDFVSDERVVWVDTEEVPLNFWSRETFLKKFKVIFKGNVYMARAKELFAWTLIFLDHKESEYISDDESLHGAKNKSVGSQHGEDNLVDDSDVKGVSETFFGDKHPSLNNSVCNSSEKVVDQQPEDPFCIYDVLNKKPKGLAQDSDSSLSHPPGFTPEVSQQENDHRGVDLNTETDKMNSPLVHTKVINNSQEVHENVISNGEFAFSYSHNAHNGGLILEVLEDMIRVGQSMGYAMEGCMKDIKHIIGTHPSATLVDVKLEGYSFTWAHPSATKMNHRPILLREIHTDYGPIPFHFYHFWFKRDGFDVMVEQAWNYFSHSDTNGLILFMKKLQDLKKIIRSWIKDKKLQQYGAINSIKEDLIDIDKNLDSRNVSDEILLKRMELTRQLHDINQMEARDYVQKLKIKWTIEGDENSKFFHDVFKDHFATRFKQPAHGRLKLNISFLNRLSTDQVGDMDRRISRDEIRVAVWNYGENKSLGPDGFPRLFALETDKESTVASKLGSSPAPKGVLLEMESIRNKFFIGSDQVDKKITWIAWDKVFSSKKKGGLGVFSLFALNRGLILKWAWRFLSQDGSVWARVINAIYGSNISSHDDKLSSNWCSILRIGSVLDKPFYVRFPRIFALETDKPVFVAAKWEAPSFEFSFRCHVKDGVETEQWMDLLSLINTVSLSSSNDRWICDLNGEGVYRVKDICYSLDNLFLPTSDIVTRWIKVIPIKINVFVWRARLDRLSTRLNLSKRGVSLVSSLCPICNLEDLQVVGYKLERYLILRRL
uniref:RNA-directed DNA polymerase, eukaryota n=1 Tax=Tanacetum cinerariifolium TaxID=118510 RepID=A0A6L2NWQ4_TANCI|nr:RNA-directed DNA polymerase, eukaryota [Tanacetum cinerariifolium]